MESFQPANELTISSHEDFMREGYLSVLIQDADKFKYKKCMKRIDLVGSFNHKPIFMKLLLGIPIVIYKNIANTITISDDKNMDYFCITYEGARSQIEKIAYEKQNDGYGVLTLVRKNT
jgi:hypothetical protein